MQRPFCMISFHACSLLASTLAGVACRGRRADDLRVFAQRRRWLARGAVAWRTSDELARDLFLPAVAVQRSNGDRAKLRQAQLLLLLNRSCILLPTIFADGRLASWLHRNVVPEQASRGQFLCLSNGCNGTSASTVMVCRLHGVRRRFRARQRVWCNQWPRVALRCTTGHAASPVTFAHAWPRRIGGPLRRSPCAQYEAACPGWCVKVRRQLFRLNWQWVRCTHH